MFLVVMRMAPQNADSESVQVQELPVALPDLQKPGSADAHEETISEGSIDRIPVRLWVMHGAVMFGREFCYAMETALVTPVLLQIGKCCPRLCPVSGTERWQSRLELACMLARGACQCAGQRQEPWEPASRAFCSPPPTLAIFSLRWVGLGCG